MKPRVRHLRFCTVLVLAASIACQIGPGRLKIAGSHYSDAVRVATSEQLLVNLVRLRYRDLPVFLGVSNISTQFELEASADIASTVNAGKGNDSLEPGVGLRYSERPTITFSIQGGEEFQKRMLQPLKVVAISLLAESGWRGDRVLRLTVEGMNGLKNAPTASGPTPTKAPRYADFLEATSLIHKLSREGLIELEYQIRDDTISAALPIPQVEGGDVVAAAKAGAEFKVSPDGKTLELVAEKRTLVMLFTTESATSAEATRLRDLLRLKRGQSRFDVVALEDSELDPFQPDQRIGELALDTRSLMGVLYYLSHGVQAPRDHLDAGFATDTVDADGKPFDWSAVLGGLFEVRSSGGRRRPSNASVAVSHRGQWFYIADEDETSKATFILVNQLFSLQAGDVEETKPVLTLPVGG